MYIANIEAALQNIAGLDRRDADRLTDQIIDMLIDKVLSRDTALPRRTSIEWLVKLADAHSRIAELINRRIHGRVTLDDVSQVIAASER
jgi:hypothetical protein